MYHDTDEFNRLMGMVESKATTPSQRPSLESHLPGTGCNLEPFQEGILQNGINRMSNLLSANLKSKISNEWKHLTEDERVMLLRLVSGNASIFSDENADIDVAIAKAFKDGTLSPTKGNDGSAAIVVNKSIDISDTGAEQFPMISIAEISGSLKCNYSSFKSFVGFPQKVGSLELSKGRNVIENMSGFPTVTGKNENNYSIDLKMTKLGSLRGWKPTAKINGHVSFKGCDLKDISVDGPVYIVGSLDLRDNPHISIESLKSILIKDFSTNQILVKGKIYHTLESDGFYSSAKFAHGPEAPSEDLGPLTEAKGVNRAGVAMTQEELWKIGPEIIKQAEARKAKRQNGSAKETMAAKIKPEVQTLVSNMASSQLDQNAVSQASQKITSGMTSTEFRTMMKGLFDNLLKQLTVMMRDSGMSDSSNVDKSVETITKVAAELVADKMEGFAKVVDGELKSGSCFDSKALGSQLDEIIKSMPQIGTSDAKILQQKLLALEGAKSDRVKYEASLRDFVNLLHIGILGNPEVAESVINKSVEACFGEESKPEDSQSSEAPVTVDNTPTPEPAAEPEPTPAQEPTPESEPIPTPEPEPIQTQTPEVKSAPAKNTRRAGESKLAQGNAKSSGIKQGISTRAVSPSEEKGLERFSRLIGGISVNSDSSEAK